MTFDILYEFLVYRIVVKNLYNLWTAPQSLVPTQHHTLVLRCSRLQQYSLAGMSNLLASLGRRRVASGHTLNTQTITKTDEQKKGFKWISDVLVHIQSHPGPSVGQPCLSFPPPWLLCNYQLYFLLPSPLSPDPETLTLKHMLPYNVIYSFFLFFLKDFIYF